MSAREMQFVLFCPHKGVQQLHMCRAHPHQRLALVHPPAWRHLLQLQQHKLSPVMLDLGRFAESRTPHHLYIASQAGQSRMSPSVSEVFE